MLVTPGWESSAFHLQILGTGAPPGMAPQGTGGWLRERRATPSPKVGCATGGDKGFLVPRPLLPPADLPFSQPSAPGRAARDVAEPPLL